MDKRILVTGAAGMVGSHVVDLLAQLPSRPTVLPVTRTECDLRDFAATRKLFERLQPTHVFHPAACVYGIIGNMTNQGQSFLDNTLINTAVIDASRHVGVKKITVMGTGCMYPYPPIKLPLVEEDIFMGRPHDSEAGYAHAKLGMLAMLESYSKYFDWACVISCNLFGPRDKFDPINGHVVPSLIRKFYEAKRDHTNVTVWGDGSAKRDFIYIKDCARVVAMVMAGVSGPINMGTDNVLPIRYIINQITRISGLDPAAVIWDASKPNGVDYRGYDLSKLNALGFEPHYSIATGLQETWDWYCQQQENRT
jgi:GDP-L-fucose synthase